MDRISALRNVEDALREFENGECDLSTLERRVRGTVRTYATQFETDGTAPYRVTGDDAEVVVVASDPADARARARRLGDIEGDLGVDRLD
ncbi:hypothetical protein [Haloglomus halophilum]|jgi:hypothetical protein|uniref:DUF7854 family protein n=1 Tax=Haloglomus halophilum TaxID=2962672 RepID=UPI0020C98680|nr:hypothetical protein [Haloglomus halophilum]